jgi:hypothetical protein
VVYPYCQLNFLSSGFLLDENNFSGKPTHCAHC